MKYFIYLFPIVFMIGACSDDDILCGNPSCVIDTPCSEGSCLNLADSIQTWGSIQYRHIHNSKYAFSISPNNPSLIAYFQHKEARPIDSIALIIENLSDHSIIEIMSGTNFYMKPAWDKDNNVIFSNAGLMMKYNMNTDIIEQVSFNNIPGEVFSIDGSKLIFQELGVQSSVLDLLSGNITTSKVVSENPIASPNQSHVAYFDSEKDSIFILNTNTNIVIGLFKPDYQPLSFTWASEQELYWSSYSGLFKINIETRQVERIKKHCGTNTKVKYINPFFDVNGKFYITKEVGTQVGLIDVDLKGEIIEYDLNTCTEIDIFD
jgi:hypothetical protein